MLVHSSPPQHARELSKRLEIHYTPKHGSWLDIAEIELSALGRQCIANKRIPDLPTLRDLLSMWASSRNNAQKGVDWHFTSDDARSKLKHLYPIINF
ncbi:MAG: hypothetical protein HFE79_11895 [Ruminiclostridium sp.]|nr:hypothetical protein [Ruminiclostridium sp.]